MAGELHEVDIYGIVTTMTSDECRALAARLLKIAGDAPAAGVERDDRLQAGFLRHVNLEKDHGFVRLRWPCRDNYFFPLSAIEGACDAADLYRGRPCRFAAGLDSTGRSRVTRLILD